MQNKIFWTATLRAYASWYNVDWLINNSFKRINIFIFKEELLPSLREYCSRVCVQSLMVVCIQNVFELATKFHRSFWCLIVYAWLPI